MGRLRSLNGRIVSATTMMVQRVAVQIPAILLALAMVAHTSEVSLDDTPLASMPAPGGHMELLRGLDRREHVAAGSRVSKRNHQMLVLKSQEIDVKAKIKSKRAALQKATEAELAEVSVGEARKGAKGKGGGSKGGRKKKQIEKRMGALEKEERKVKAKIKKIQSHPALQSGAKRAAAKVKAAVKAGDKKAVKKEQKKTAKAVTKAAKQLSKATTKGQKKKAEKKLAKAQSNAKLEAAKEIS